MAATITFTLPEINGDLELGIAVGADPGVGTELRLPVLEATSMTASDQYNSMIAWAMKNEKFRNYSESCKKLLLNAIAGICKAGLICRRSSDPNINDMNETVVDGDWVAASAPITVTNEEIAAFGVNPATAITEHDMRQALLIIIATKANWWAMNHHTGQGSLQGYVKKVIEIQYDNTTDRQITEVAHMIGHWTSTLFILRLAGITELRSTVRAWNDADFATINFYTDAALRFTSLPAGTHRLGAAYEGARRLIRSSIAIFTPNIENLAELPEARKRVLANRAQYHVGAMYLCNAKAENYEDTQYENHLGRVGTYVNIFMPRSSLSRSPHRATEKVTAYPDYSVEFEGLRKQLKMAQISNANQAITKIISGTQGVAEGVIKGVKGMFSGN